MYRSIEECIWYTVMILYVCSCSHVALLVCGDWSVSRAVPLGTSPAQPCCSAFTDMSYVTAGVYDQEIDEGISVVGSC